MISQNRKRAVGKAISYRGLGSLLTVVVIYIFTGKLTLSIGAGIVEGISKMLFFYLHERLWEKISWGKEKHPLSGIPVTRELEPEDKILLEERLKELGYL
ncbi:MAG: DUF2061 domain-containing protein [bacterium]